MPQPKKGHSLGSNPSHQNLMLRNMARSLFQHERIRTTEAKAKLLRPFAEKLITKAKKGSVHDRRQVLAVIEDRVVVHKLFDDIGPRFADRNGGYTRILKVGPRQGDAAPMAFIELVDEGGFATTVTETGETTGGSGRRGRLRRPGRRRRPEEAAASDEQREDVTDEPEAGEEGASPGDADSETSQGTPGSADAEAGEQPEAEAEAEPEAVEEATPAEAEAEPDQPEK